MSNTYFPNISAKVERLTKVAEEYPLSYELYTTIKDTSYEMFFPREDMGNTAILLIDPTPEVVDKVGDILTMEGCVFTSRNSNNGSVYLSINEGDARILDRVVSFTNLEKM